MRSAGKTLVECHLTLDQRHRRRRRVARRWTRSHATAQAAHTARCVARTQGTRPPGDAPRQRRSCRVAATARSHCPGAGARARGYPLRALPRGVLGAGRPMRDAPYDSSVRVLPCEHSRAVQSRAAHSRATHSRAGRSRAGRSQPRQSQTGNPRARSQTGRSRAGRVMRNAFGAILPCGRSPWPPSCGALSCAVSLGVRLLYCRAATVFHVKHGSRTRKGPVCGFT